MSADDIAQAENVRFQQALEQGMNTFWSEIAAHYPEVKTGDVTPDENYLFEMACTGALADWLANNRSRPDA